MAVIIPYTILDHILGMTKGQKMQYVKWLEQLGMGDVEEVGGKNASLGELINNLEKMSIKVPTGFATTSSAFREFLDFNDLNTKIYSALAELDVDDVSALGKTGQAIREWVLASTFPPNFAEELNAAIGEIEQRCGAQATFAVRSSATAEDLPDASFAGQQDSYLNVSGQEHILQAIKQVYASLFTDRAIAYRVHQQFDHQHVAISAGVQQMVRSDLACSGVMFTLDTESGFDDVVFITAGYGLGEMLVQGAINPDEYYVYKPNLQTDQQAILKRTVGSKKQHMVYSDDPRERVSVVATPAEQQRLLCLQDAEVTALAHYAEKIQAHYGCHMDIEWAKDGNDGQLYIVQARPETVQSRRNTQQRERYQLEEQGTVLCAGRSIGQRIGVGTARVINSLQELERVQPGDVLVSDMTDPDWEPVMKRAAAIVTNRGGRTCHAAIIARELGIPAVVGCGDATTSIEDGDKVTVCCAEGDEGYVYAQALKFSHQIIAVDAMPELPVKVMLNVANPDRAFAFHGLPNAGVGLARMEFIINNMIGIHPMALLQYEQLDESLKSQIGERIAAYGSPREYFIERLREGIATIAAAFQNKPVILRLSDFKSNEYRHLLGGERYEPHEENPMIGFRGASRYIKADFAEAFTLELEAIKRVRNDMGFKHLQIMIPFVRTVSEAQAVTELLAQHGLKRGEDDLRLIMMCEIPSNALLADEFLEYFDGFSIGSNDLTQLTLGLDRDSALVADCFDERDAAVKKLLQMAIQACRAQGKYIGICGQGPSDHPDLARWLMAEGIDSMSLNPDTVIDTSLFLASEANNG